MTKKQIKANSGRKVHVTLSEKTHQQLRIKCAIEDVTIQGFVARLIENSVTNVEVMQNGGQTQKVG
nr:hypothetical protein [uncultured Sphaerochaeta sp.]